MKRRIKGIFTESAMMGLVETPSVSEQRKPCALCVCVWGGDESVCIKHVPNAMVMFPSELHRVDLSGSKSYCPLYPIPQHTNSL